MASNFNTLSYIFENEDIQEYAQENQKLITESVNTMIPKLYNDISRYVNGNIEQFMSNDLSDVYESISEYASNYIYENLDFGSFVLSQEQIDESDRKSYYLEEKSWLDSVSSDRVEILKKINLKEAERVAEQSRTNEDAAKALADLVAKDIQSTAPATPPPQAEAMANSILAERGQEELRGIVNNSMQKQFSKNASSLSSNMSPVDHDPTQQVVDALEKGPKQNQNFIEQIGSGISTAFEEVKDAVVNNKMAAGAILVVGVGAALVGIGAYVNSKRLHPIIKDTIKKITKESGNLSDSDKSKIMPMAKKAMECGKAKDAKCSFDNVQQMVDFLDKKGADTRKIKKNLSKIERQIK